MRPAFRNVTRDVPEGFQPRCHTPITKGERTYRIDATPTDPYGCDAVICRAGRAGAAWGDMLQVRGDERFYACMVDNQAMSSPRRSHVDMALEVYVPSEDGDGPSFSLKIVTARDC